MVISWWLALLAGCGIGLLLVIVIVPITKMFKNAAERRRVKRMIRDGKYLMPLDIKDLGEEQAKIWGISKEQLQKNADQLKQLNDQIFKRKDEQKTSKSENI